MTYALSDTLKAESLVLGGWLGNKRSKVMECMEKVMDLKLDILSSMTITDALVSRSLPLRGEN